MPNPFDFVREIRGMNEDLTQRLDKIIERIEWMVDRLDTLIELEKSKPSTTEILQQVWYGDGK